MERTLFLDNGLDDMVHMVVNVLFHSDALVDNCALSLKMSLPVPLVKKHAAIRG